MAIVSGPSDVYVHGMGYLWRVPGAILGCLTLTKVTVPFVYSLQEPSIYAYLAKRFNSNTLVTIMGMGLGLVCSVIHCMLLTFTTALTLAELVGLTVEQCIMAIVITARDRK